MTPSRAKWQRSKSKMNICDDEEEGTTADAGKKKADGRVKFEKVSSEACDMITL